MSEHDAPRVAIFHLTRETLDALADGNLARARATCPVEITDWLGPSPLDGRPIGASDFYDLELKQVSRRAGRHTAGGRYSVDHQPAWDLREATP